MIRAAQVISVFFTLIVAFFLWVLMGTPSVANINKCITTKTYKVSLCESNPQYARLSQISPQLKHMIVIAEDASFYSHSGFDKDELKKSISTNLNAKKLARGGSTITQQLAKNVFLPFNKSIIRKLREALLTIQLEKILSKNQILEKYLNVIEFGPHIYGVQSAAKYYFNKSPSELNLLESAFLVFLVPNPKSYAQSFRNKKLTPYAKYRILDLCYRMYRFNKITFAQYEEAKALVNDFPWTDLTTTQQDALNGIAPDSEVPTLTEVPSEDKPDTDESVEPVEPPEEVENDSPDGEVHENPITTDLPPESNEPTTTEEPFEQ